MPKVHDLLDTGWPRCFIASCGGRNDDKDASPTVVSRDSEDRSVTVLSPL